MQDVKRFSCQTNQNYYLFAILFFYFTAFYNEVLESLQRGYEEKIKGDNLVLEINSSKYAYNVTMKEVNMLVIKAMLSLPSVMTKVNMSRFFKTWIPS